MMRTLYVEPHFTFRFTEERWIDRVHLTDVPAGKIARAYRLNVSENESKVCIASGVTDERGWVAFAETVHVYAGDGFLVVVE